MNLVKVRIRQSRKRTAVVNAKVIRLAARAISVAACARKTKDWNLTIPRKNSSVKGGSGEKCSNDCNACAEGNPEDYKCGKNEQEAATEK